MTDEHDEIQREESRRYWRETWKERSILVREYLYTAIALIVAVMLVWALWSWRNANNAAGAAQARLMSIADRLDAKLEALDTERINRIADSADGVLVSARKRIDALQTTQTELDHSIIALRSNVDVLTNSVAARLQTLDGAIVGLRRVEDSVAAQVKARGDEVGRTINATTDFITHKDTEIASLINEGTKLIQTNNPKVAKILDDFDVVIIGNEADPENSLRGLVKRGNATMDGLAKTSNNIALLTGDIREKERSILFPPPDKGFTGFMKKFVLRPITTFGGAAYLVERLVYNLP